MASPKRRAKAGDAWKEPEILRNLDAEQAVLGCVLIEPRKLGSIRCLLRVSDFALAQHRAIFEAMCEIADRGNVPDELTVCDCLKSHGQLDEATGDVFVSSLPNLVPHSEGAPQWARIVLEYSQRQARKDLGCAYVQAAHFPDALSLAEIARQQARLEDIERRMQGDGDGAAAGPQLLGTTLADVEVEELHWLWRGRVALGKLTMVDGDPGLGKSLMTLDLAARVAMGQAMPDGSPGLDAPAGVALICGEDGLADTVKPRLLAAGASPEALNRIHAFNLVSELGPDGTASERLVSLATDLLQLEAKIIAMNVRLLVIDPITAYLGRGTDMYKDADLRLVLTPLAMMAERTGVAVLLVRHLNKSSGTLGLHRGLGGVGFIGVARLALLLAPNPDVEGEVLVSRYKGNVGAPPATLAYRVVQVGEAENMPRISWLGEREATAEDGLAAQGGAGVDREARSATDEATEWLRACLVDGPRPKKEIIEDAVAAGIIPDTHHDKPLRTARTRLGVVVPYGVYREGGIGGDGRWMWRLPTLSLDADSPRDDDAHASYARHLSQKDSTVQPPKAELNGAAAKIPKTEHQGHLSTEKPPKMPLQRERGIFERDHNVCRVTGGSHSYYMQRTHDRRRVCIECQEPAPPRMALHQARL